MKRLASEVLLLHWHWICCGIGYKSIAAHKRLGAMVFWFSQAQIPPVRIQGLARFLVVDIGGTGTKYCGLALKSADKDIVGVGGQNVGVRITSITGQQTNRMSSLQQRIDAKSIPDRRAFCAEWGKRSLRALPSGWTGP